MARSIHRLNTLAINRASERGYYPDGAGRTNTEKKNIAVDSSPHKRRRMRPTLPAALCR
jgi:hypothetical protein